MSYMYIKALAAAGCVVYVVNIQRNLRVQTVEKFVSKKYDLTCL